MPNIPIHPKGLSRFPRYMLTACNPIPAEPNIPTPLPTPSPSPEREPMQASLYNFDFAEFEGGKFNIDPELYADAILKVRDCMEEELFEGADSPYTPGQIAAGQWFVIWNLVTHFAPEEPEPDVPNVSISLIKAQELCMVDQ